MATRLPPAHAPAWGRRRQEGIAEPTRGDATPGNGRAVGQTRRAGVDPSTLVESISLRETDTEDRNRKRRLDDEAYQKLINQRAHKGRRTRARFERREARQADEGREHQRFVQEHHEGRREIVRALEGLDRADRLLMQGKGKDAAVLLMRESGAARASARGLGRGTPAERILSALAANMDVRAETARAVTPGHAKLLARNMERVAAGTDRRAEGMANNGLKSDARVLKSVAADSRVQAGLLRAGAANTDALLGRALARVLSGMARADGRASAKLDRALMKLDRALDGHRVPLHRVLRSKEPTQTVRLLRSNARTKDLLRPLENLSVALSRGDPRGVNQAARDLLTALGKTGRVPQLDGLLRSLPGPRSTSDSRVLLEQVLPRVLLDGIRNGGLRDLGSSEGLARWLSELPGMPRSATTLHPGERVILSNGQPLSAAALGPMESLILGSPGFHTAQSVATHAASIPEAQSFATALQAGLPLSALPPAGTHEHAVLVAPDGAVMVRSDEGPLFFKGSVVGEDQQRYYYNTVPLDQSLERVVFQSSVRPSETRTRIDMGVRPPERLDPAAADAARAVQYGMPVELPLETVDGIDEDETTEERSRRKKRKDRPQAAQGEVEENLAVVAIFDDSPEPAGYQGLATRFAARVAQDELVRANRELSEDDRVEHLYLEYASDCSVHLSAMGFAHAGAFQEHLNQVLEAQGFSPDAVGALILIAPETIPAAPVRAPEATLLSSGIVTTRLRSDPCVESGIMLYAESIVID